MIDKIPFIDYLGEVAGTRGLSQVLNRHEDILFHYAPPMLRYEQSSIGLSETAQVYLTINLLLA